MTANDTVNAKAIFDSIISSRLGIHEVPKYTIADVKPEKKVIKVIMGNRELKGAVLKQARISVEKLSWAVRMFFLSDDSPPQKTFSYPNQYS